MSKKKIEVIELNKKEEQIILEEHKNSWSAFWKKYGKLIFILTLVLSFSSFIIGLFITISNMYEINEPSIKKAYVDTQFPLDSSEITIGTMTPITDETARNTFMNNRTFKNDGEILLIKKYETSNYTIRYYSDGTALKIINSTGFITRISALTNGSYGISDDGTIDSNAKMIDINVKESPITYPWGTVTFYSDGSAEITNSQINMFVRNASDIKEKYISNNKISYYKETTSVGTNTLNYYYDGTIEVIKNNKSFLVHNPEDINITTSDVFFPNNNEAIEIKNVKLADDKNIYYYSDGSAIIKYGTKSISVRKNNSIVLKNNLIYEIINNIYVDITNTNSSGNITYYSNGSAIVDYNNKTLFISDNSSIKYSNGNISNVGIDFEEKTSTRTVKENTITVFKTMAIVVNPQYKAIVNKNNILYDSDGGLKEILTNSIKYDDRSFTITNNSSKVINYKIVLERSNKTTLVDEYIKYQLFADDTYIPPAKLNINIWQADANSAALGMTGTNYILADSTLEPFASSEIKIMFWTDYETIPNSMQNKYFYGTIKIYAWEEETE